MATEISDKLKSLKIMVVDDEEDLLESMIDILESYGLQVSSASSGNEAYEKISANTGYEVVLSDIMMPNGTGIELLEQAQKNLSPIPTFVFISAFTEESKQRLSDKGVKACFEKPVDYDKLIERLEEIAANKN